jgi:SAM-dependent methyltransferase
MNNGTTTLDAEQAVRERYSAGAERVEAALCCPITDYDQKLLAIVPDEIIKKDYGCGDPSAFVREGDTVLDLGSGGGKICYIASQLVGAEGRVIGIDMNDDMLALARRYQKQVGDQLGYHNVAFKRGRIQDLELDLDRVAAYLQDNPANDLPSLEALRAYETQLRRSLPLVPSNSVDLIMSNCVLNLVSTDQKELLFSEIYRVLKPGGRIAISDIVSDEDVPQELQNDPELWSGCISGSLREDRFVDAFRRVGLYGITIVKRGADPWQVVDGIEFRSVTVIGYKGKEGPCMERKQAVVYKGPFSRVHDDDDHTYERGALTAVCDKTYKILSKEPYAEHFYPVEPLAEIPLSEATVFDCDRHSLRHPRELKGEDYDETRIIEDCGPGCC